jgi:hypothetical protein
VVSKAPKDLMLFKNRFVEIVPLVLVQQLKALSLLFNNLRLIDLELSQLPLQINLQLKLLVLPPLKQVKELNLLEVV